MARDRRTAGPLRVVIAGGGTGGHLYPGIAVARELLGRVPDAVVSFAGTAQGIEARVVPREGFALDVIRSGGLKGKSLADRAARPGAAAARRRRCVAAALDAPAASRDRRRRLQLGAGRCAGGAARHPDAAAGAERRTRPDQPHRWRRSCGRPPSPSTRRCRTSGERGSSVAIRSVRQFLEHDAAARADERDAPVGVLIFGGSQGAHAINVAAVEAAPELAASGHRLAITHQTGERDLEMVREAYVGPGSPRRVEPFLYEMDREMKRGARDRLPRRRDDAGRDHRRRPRRGARAAADGDRRSPAEERGGARGGARPRR